MNKFIEIASRHGRLFYINVAQIVCIENFETYRIIYLTDKDNIETFEGYESIKAKIDKNTEVTRHGEWIKASCSEKDGDAHCSECHHWDWSDCKYCSECGAKMDGKRRTDNE